MGLFFVGIIIGILLELFVVQDDQIAEPASIILTPTSVAIGNTTVVLVLVLGGFLLAIPTVIALVTNGVAFGVVLISVGMNHGVNVLILTILPHGLLELPAIIFAGMLGLRISHYLLTILTRSAPHPRQPFLHVKWLAWLGITHGLIFVAAVIEVTLPPILTNNFL